MSRFRDEHTCSLRGGNGNPLQSSSWEIPWTEEPGGLVTGVTKEWDTTEQRSTCVYPVHRTTHSRPARQRPSSKRFGLQRPVCGQLPPLSSWASLCISTLTGQGACQGHKSRRIRIALTWRRGSSEVRWAAGLYQACSTRFCHSQAPSLSWVQLLATPWTAAHQAPLSMGFPRQEYRSGLPFPSPGDLSEPGMEPRSLALQADSLPSEPPGTSLLFLTVSLLT